MNVALAAIVASSLWLFGFRYPRLALLVRQLRRHSIWLVHAWLVVRCLPNQPSRSLLEIGWDFLEENVKQPLLSAVEEDGAVPPALSRALGLVVNWTWRLLGDAAACAVLLSALRILYCLCHYTASEWFDASVQALFEWSKDNVPGMDAELEKQSDNFIKNADATLLNKDPERKLTLKVPETGLSHAEILKSLETSAAKEDAKWKEGKVSGTVYTDDRQHLDMMASVFKAYNAGNPLHPGFWPRLSQCEAEVVAMTADLLHAPTVAPGGGGIGALTSGGTESIILAVRAHLNHYGRRRGIANPEIVCGSTAHAALNKACDMFGIRMVVIDCDDKRTYQLNPSLVRRRVTSSTIMVYASAPCYPQGVVDPIAELSSIAKEYDIGLHVDACLGGFFLPFLGDSSDPTVNTPPPPVYDFRCPGVTSMSADTHKYGYAAKGTSVVLFRTKRLRHAMYFSYPHWSGGMYSTPTIPGSRPGALGACAWASLVAIGKDGYRKRVRKIHDAAIMVARGVRSIPGLTLMTPRPYMVVAFGGSDGKSGDTGPAVDIYRVCDVLSAQGWSLNELQSPPSIHICVTLNMVPKVAVFLRDLRTAVAHVKKEGEAGKVKGTAGIYGAGKAHLSFNSDVAPKSRTSRVQLIYPFSSSFSTAITLYAKSVRCQKDLCSAF